MTATPPDTRSGHLTERELAIIERVLASGGARVSVSDPRLTKAIVGLLVAVGGITITVGTWLVTEAIARGRLDERVVTILEQHDRRLNRLEERRP